MRIRGEWKYLYRAVDKAGATVDFLLTAMNEIVSVVRCVTADFALSKRRKRLPVQGIFGYTGCRRKCLTRCFW